MTSSAPKPTDFSETWLHEAIARIEADYQRSADTHRTGDATLTAPGSRIEGIGRPRVEPSFIRTLVDRLIDVPDVESIRLPFADVSRTTRS